jgi:hypothetical protein
VKPVKTAEIMRVGVPACASAVVQALATADQGCAADLGDRRACVSRNTLGICRSTGLSQRFEKADQVSTDGRIVLPINHCRPRRDRLSVGQPAVQQACIPALPLHRCLITNGESKPWNSSRLPSHQTKEVGTLAMGLALAEGVALTALADRQLSGRAKVVRGMGRRQHARPDTTHSQQNSLSQKQRISQLCSAPPDRQDLTASLFAACAAR